jgi:hypothetical protein
MSDFVSQQWNRFCENMERTARFRAGSDSSREEDFLQSARKFCKEHVPEDYSGLLKSIAEGTALTLQWSDNDESSCGDSGSAAADNDAATSGSDDS